MARQRVITLSADDAVKLKDVGSVSGYFIGSKEGIKTNYEKDSTLHIFQTETGKLGVWGFKNLDEQLAGIPKGTMTWLEFAGVGKSHKKGFKPPLLASVDFDPELRIDVSNITLSNETGSESSYETEDGGDTGTENTDTEATVEDEVAAAAPVRNLAKGRPSAISAEQQAKVAAMLAKSRNAGAVRSG